MEVATGAFYMNHRAHCRNSNVIKLKVTK